RRRRQYRSLFNRRKADAPDARNYPRAPGRIALRYGLHLATRARESVARDRRRRSCRRRALQGSTDWFGTYDGMAQRRRVLQFLRYQESDDRRGRNGRHGRREALRKNENTLPARYQQGCLEPLCGAWKMVLRGRCLRFQIQLERRPIRHWDPPIAKDRKI